MTDLLTGGQPVAKALASGSVFKAGKAMSNANKETLTSIYDSLGAFLEKFNDEQEETDVTKKEIADAIAEGVAKALAPAQQQPEAVEKAAENNPITAEAIEKMVDAAVKKALAPAEDDEEPVTAENIQKMIEVAVEKAVAPVRKAAGVPSNLNDDEDDGEDGVEKAAPHYLAGIL